MICRLTRDLHVTLYRSGTLKERAEGFSPPRGFRKGSMLWNTMEIYCRLQMPKNGRLFTHKIQPPAATCITSNISAKHIGTFKHHALIPFNLASCFMLLHFYFARCFSEISFYFGTVWMLLKSLNVWEG